MSLTILVTHARTAVGRLHWVWLAGAMLLPATPAAADVGRSDPAWVGTPRRSGHAARYIGGEVLVRFKDGTSPGARRAVHVARGARVVRTYPSIPRLARVALAPGESVAAAVARYGADPNVLYAEPNYEIELFDFPTDPLFGDQWHLHNTGQSGGLPDADMDAPEAWDITTGSSDVVVALVDSGIAYTRPDLAANVYRNEPECDGDGVDDDLNGFVDDCFGVDTAGDTGDPLDFIGHGTAVAGLIGAVANNGIGVVGIARDARMLACNFGFSVSGGSIISVADAVECYDYVLAKKQAGVNVVATNNSWGVEAFSAALLDAAIAQMNADILLIAGAGNNADDFPFYPGSFYLPNVINVAGTDRRDELADFSSFGRGTAHMAAPAEELLTTALPVGLFSDPSGFGLFSGTSGSAPLTAGVAALLESQDPGRDFVAIRNLLLAGADPLPALADVTVTGRRLNAAGALSCSGRIVQSRMRPARNPTLAVVGGIVNLSAYHLDCANPAGNVDVNVGPGGQVVTLLDDGLGFDELAGDGLYSAQWVAPAAGTFTLSFPDGDVTVEVSLDGLVSPEPEESAFFGSSIAVDGGRILIGAPGGDGVVGGAQLFDTSNGELLRDFGDPALGVADDFGAAVDLQGDRVAIGAPKHSGGALEAGVAYLFDATTGQLTHTLANPTPEAGDGFGSAVALFDDYLLVGSPFEDEGETDAGVVHLFDASTGQLLLTFPNPSPEFDPENQLFGEQFGAALATRGTEAWVGAPGAHTEQGGSGEVYAIDVDPQSPTVGVVAATLAALPSEGSPVFPDDFGTSVAIDGDLVLIGDSRAGDRPPGTTISIPAGAAHLYDAITGTRLVTYRNPDPTRVDAFGFGVDLEDDHVLIGALGARLAGPETGAAYLFDRASGELIGIFVAPVARPLDGFGTAVGALGDGFFVGAPRDDTAEINAGAVYRYGLPLPQDFAKCYKAKKGPGATPFASLDVALENGLEAKLTTVRKPRGFCNPASVDGRAIVDADGHLTCFQIKDAKGQPKFTRPDVRLWNLFGVQSLSLKKSKQLCVPSSLDGGNVATDLDHYQCYTAKRAKLEPKFERVTVDLDDAFDSKQTLVIKPTAFCAAVDKNGEGLNKPGNHLTCYKIKEDKSQPGFPGLDLTAGNQFGGQSLTARRAETVCLPTQRLQ